MVSTYIGFPTETIIVFIALSVDAIFIDLFTHRDDKPISFKSAAPWFIFWVVVAMALAGLLHIHHGAEVASPSATGYVLREVLSVDNLFVTIAISFWLIIPDRCRHRVLYWGITGAIVLRGIFATIGTSLLSLGPHVEAVFAIIAAWMAVMMLKSGDDGDEIEDYSQHLAYRMAKRFFPIWSKLRGHVSLLNQKEVDAKLAKPENSDVTIGRGKKAALYVTPLLLCVAVVELSDVMFAFDSVPAIIAVSCEPLTVYSTMMFAILGLRTLYFVLEALKQYLIHLEKVVIVPLFFIAVKLDLNATDHIWHHGYSITATISLYVVLGVLTLGTLAGVMFPGKPESEEKGSQFP